MTPTAKRVFKEALGIQTGHIIRTSYGTGPYEVFKISGPHLFQKGLDIIVYPVPVIHLVLRYTPGHHLYEKGGKAYINEVYREGERWFTLTGDEVFVASSLLGSPKQQMALFGQEQVKPYPFRDGVDYNAGLRQVWHCERCGLDFNCDMRGTYSPPFCPACDWIASTKIIIAAQGENTYLKTIS